MPYRVINIYYSVTCYTNHINSTRIQSIASMALMVFPDGVMVIAVASSTQVVGWQVIMVIMLMVVASSLMLVVGWWWSHR